MSVTDCDSTRSAGSGGAAQPVDSPMTAMSTRIGRRRLMFDWPTRRQSALVSPPPPSGGFASGLAATQPMKIW